MSGRYKKDDRDDRYNHRSISSVLDHRASYRENDHHNEDRKRRRSRSRDKPRKRRSLSPSDSQNKVSSRYERYDGSRSNGNSRDRSRDRNNDHSNTKRYSSKSNTSPEPYKRSTKPLPSQQDAFKDEDKAIVPNVSIEKQKPNFGNSGRLAAASNTIQASGGKSIVLKYHEPSEARKPSAKDPWRMYVFKDDEILDTVQLFEQSCWLFGREAAVVDFLIEHPSCSKQHAVIQFRYIEKRSEFGDKIGKVKPYILDLESSNGTSVNEERIPEGRYVELRDKDMVRFGSSTREYVIQLPSKL